MQDEVLEFIQRRFIQYGDCHWTDGNCYYFAEILHHRFPYLDIVYLAIRGHFMAKCGHMLYDFTGKHYIDEYQDDVILSLNKIQKEDPLWYNRIERDCIK